MPVKKRVPADDMMSSQQFEFQGDVFTVKKKFKIARFLRDINTAPIDAIELVLEPEDFERFLDMEMDMDELKAFLEGLSNALSGSDLKN